MNATRLLAAAWAAAAVLASACAFSQPFGGSTDEALFVILARALLRGRFAVPGPLGWVVTDPWPGYPLLLALAQAAAGAHWAALRLFGLACWAGYAWACRRLCRRFMDERTASLCALLAAVCPAALAQAGQASPDLAFAALAAFALAEFAARRPPAAWAGAAALAAVTRPHGALLLGAVGFASLLEKRRSDALAAAAAAGPLALLLVRNRLVAGSLTDYASHWRAQALPSLGQRVWNIAGAVLGQGFCGLDARAGAAVLAVFAAALALRARSDAKGRPALAPLLFATSVIALHLTWSAVSPRYALPLAPVFFAALPALGRRGFGLCAVALAGLSLWWGVRQAAAFPAPAILEPETMAWIEANTPPDARLESFASMPILLFTGRAAAAPGRRVTSRDAWLASLVKRRVSYVHVFGLRSDGWFPDEVRALASAREGWARGLACFRVVYENPKEGSAIFRFEHPAPERFEKAWDFYETASRLAFSGGGADEIRAALMTAVRLEPDLAVGWAALSGVEKRPAARLDDLRRAARADPTSAPIAQDLAAAERAARGGRE